MKRLFIQAAKIVLVLIVLLNLTLAFGFRVDSSINFVIEWGAEGSEELNAEEDMDDFFYQTIVSWVESDYSRLLVHGYYLTSFAEEHTCEIVPPPPQA